MFLQVYREEGFSALYKGVVPRMCVQVRPPPVPLAVGSPLRHLDDRLRAPEALHHVRNLLPQVSLPTCYSVAFFYHPLSFAPPRLFLPLNETTVWNCQNSDQ